MVRRRSKKQDARKAQEALEVKALSEHLEDLRKTLMFCLLSVAAAFLIIFTLYAKQLVNWVIEPLTADHIQVIFTGLPEAFAAQTKLSLVAGLLAVSPLLAAAIWLFIRPGLLMMEQLWTGALTAVGLGLFWLGMWFGYHYVFYLAVHFFVYAGEGIAEPMIALGTYVSFLFGFLLAFGAAFELPVVIICLTRLGLVTSTDLKKIRKYVVFGVFILAAVLTPPDVISQVLLAGPLLILYEAGIFFSWLFAPNRQKQEAAQNLS